MKSRHWIFVCLLLVAAAVVLLVVANPARGSHPRSFVVAEFDNQTGDPDLDLLGSRIGHWITHDLQHAAIPITPWDFAIESWEYVQEEVAAGRVHDPVRELAAETGADAVVFGSIHLLQADSLELRLNLFDVGRERSLGDIDPLRVALSDADEIITVAQQQVQAFLAPRIGEDLFGFVEPETIGSPPRLEAYAAYREGERLFIEAEGVSEEAVALFRKVADLDSTWVLPVARMHTAAIPFQYGLDPSFNVSELLRSTQARLEELRNRMSPYERAIMESEPGSHNVPELRRLPALRRAAELAPGSAAVWNLALHVSFRNRPREALDLLRSLTHQRRWVQMEDYWFQLGGALHRLGEHESDLEAARRCRELHPGAIRCMANEARALATLGQVDEFSEVLEGIRAAPDVWDWPWAAVRPIEHLQASGNVEAASHEAEHTVSLFEAAQRTDSWTLYHHGHALWLSGRLEDARNTVDALLEQAPLHIGAHGMRGVLAAVLGDTAVALEELRWGESVGDERARSICAQIAGALGETERAVEYLREAIANGMAINTSTAVSVAFRPLRDNPEVQKLLRPKG